jgi:membrane fusion protein (multidrug efflux system)
MQFRDITIDQSTGSFILRIVFSNPDKTLLPGMFVQAILETGINKQAILIPQQAVARNAKGRPTTLTIGQGDKIEQRQLELGQALGDKWLVSSGLAPGDRIVVEGTQKIKPGVVVNAIPFDGDKSSPVKSEAASAAVSK